MRKRLFSADSFESPTLADTIRCVVEKQIDQLLSEIDSVIITHIDLFSDESENDSQFDLVIIIELHHYEKSVWIAPRRLGETIQYHQLFHSSTPHSECLGRTLHFPFTKSVEMQSVSGSMHRKRERIGLTQRFKFTLNDAVTKNCYSTTSSLLN